MARLTVVAMSDLYMFMESSHATFRPRLIGLSLKSGINDWWDLMCQW